MRVLDRSDVLSLLGMGEGPVRLAEGKMIAEIDNHPRMTAKVWKQIPEWIENPAAVFKSDTAEGLVFLAPETLGDAPVSIIMVSSKVSKAKGRNAWSESIVLIRSARREKDWRPEDGRQLQTAGGGIWNTCRR